MARLTALAATGDVVRVGVVSDTHLGSRDCALEELRAVYDEFSALGIDTVVHAGDVVAGLGIYRGQVTDDLAHGCTTFSDQVAHAAEVYPEHREITTLMIAGNHDLDGEFARRASNPVKALAKRRKDIVHIGDARATLVLPNGAHVLLAHGTGPSGYAVSYKAQRFIEALPERQRPGLVVLGHYHRAGLIRHEGITCLMAGCFQHQTPFLRAQGIGIDVGGWVLTMRLGEDQIAGVGTEWIGVPRRLRAVA